MEFGYPVILDLHNQPCVVIGGGPMAEEKILALLEAGADVTVIAPELTESLSHMAWKNRFKWVNRHYAQGDLDGAYLVIGADMDRSRNNLIAEEATRKRVLLNCLDDPPNCRFIFPSIHRQGDLVIALSTTGKCPALAVRIRQKLATEYGPEYAEFLKIVGGLRDRIAALVPDFGARRELWYRLVDSRAIALLKAGRREDAVDTIEDLLRR
jgi:siroheme synthase-like protein